MSAQSFACFSDLPHELQQHILEYTIIDALDDAWDNEHGSQSVRIPDGNIIWRRDIIVPISTRNLGGSYTTTGSYSLARLHGSYACSIIKFLF